MPNSTVHNHRLDQLVARIERCGLVRQHYLNKGKMCVIGHMFDMAGVLDETVNGFDWEINEHTRIPVKKSGSFVHSDRMILPTLTVCEHFGVTTQFLEELQELNDDMNSEPEDVINLINQLDV